MAGNSTFIWHGAAAQKLFRHEARRRVLLCCSLLDHEIRDSMQLGGRTESGMVVHQHGKDIDPTTGREAEKINTYVSKPGEVPRIQTGHFKAGYIIEMDPVLPIGRVGTNVPYARALEKGYEPRNLLPRPHFWPAILRVLKQMQTILTGRVPGM
jgi:hypothetical protein